MKIQRAIAPASTGAAETLKNKAVVADKTVATTAETNASAPNESYTPDAEGESRASAAFRGGVRKGVAWGKAAEKPIGGLSILAGVAIGGTALAFGGAVVGGIIGGGVGPVVASITTEGAWNFLTSSFSNVGTAIQVGSTVGAVAGLVGGAIIGKNVGDTVAHGAAFVPGFVVGYGQGFANPDSIPAPVQGEKEEPKHRSELRGAFRTQAKVLSGFGALSGAVGGFVGGAAVTAAGSLVVDVAAGDFTFKNFASQLSTPAVIGGLIGGASLAVVGGFGGEGVAKATQWTFDKTIGKATAGQPGLRERIEKKANWKFVKPASNRKPRTWLRTRNPFAPTTKPLPRLSTNGKTEWRATSSASPKTSQPLTRASKIRPQPGTKSAPPNPMPA